MPPTPLLSFPARPLVRPGVWIGFAVLAAVVDVAVWCDGYMRPLENPFLSPERAASLHFVAIAVFVFALLQAVRMLRVFLPNGRYLFPLDLVEIRGGHMIVTALHTLEDIQVRGMGNESLIVLKFADADELVLPPKGDEAFSMAPQARGEVDKALAMLSDSERLELIDPFLPLRRLPEWNDAANNTHPPKISSVPWPLVALVSLIVACAVGGAVAMAARAPAEKHLIALENKRFQIVVRERDDATLVQYIKAGGPLGKRAEDAWFEMYRHDITTLAEHVRANDALATRSDDELFAIAKSKNSIAGYEKYLTHGKLHVDEVQTHILPDLVYESVLKSTSARDLLATARKYPTHSRAAEATAMAGKLYDDAFKGYVESQERGSLQRQFARALMDRLKERGNPSVLANVTFNEFFAGSEDARRHCRSFLSESLLGSFRNDVTSVVSDNEQGMPRMDVDTKVTKLGQVKMGTSRALLGSSTVSLDVLSFSVQITATIPGRTEKLRWTRSTTWEPPHEISFEHKEYEDRDRVLSELVGKSYGAVFGTLCHVQF